jgi:transposase-like protein
VNKLYTMTLTCPRCKGKDIDYQGVLGTEEPRYSCKTCGYAGPLVLDEEEPRTDEPPGIHEDRVLLCPNCGSDEIVNTIPDKANGSFEPRYACRKCGYTGSTALKKDAGTSEGSSFPYTEIIAFFLMSVIWYLIGAGLDFAVLFFVAPAAVIILIRYLLGGARTYSVEDDLKNLNEDGLPKKELDHLGANTRRFI